MMFPIGTIWIWEGSASDELMFYKIIRYKNKVYLCEEYNRDKQGITLANFTKEDIMHWIHHMNNRHIGEYPQKLGILCNLAEEFFSY